MRHVMPNRQRALCLSGAILAASLMVLGPRLAQTAPPPDPVEELRLALPLRLDDLSNPTPNVLDFRRKTLQRKIDALTTISDLRRALALEEWKEEGGRVVVVNENLRAIYDSDNAMRQQVGKRLTEAIQNVVARGDATSRLAVANLLSEMGPTVRSLGKDDRGGFARSLTPEVIKLSHDKDLGVRQEALRALGNINANPKEATRVFVETLQTDAAGPKRLAADGLGQLMRVVSYLQKKGRGSAGVEAYRSDVLETAILVVGAIKAGLKDADPVVRAACLQALQAAGQALGELVSEPFPKKDFPPEGRPLSDDEKKDIVKLHEVLHKDIEEVKPLAASLRGQETLLVQALADADTRVRLAGISALEQVANARLRLRRRVLSVPVPMAEKALVDELNEADALNFLLKKNLGDVTRLLTDPDERVRRTAIEFLENLEEVAVPALPQLTQALSDSDRFVRWSAARAIGVIGPDQAIGALANLAKLLSDSDLSVRTAAAATLEVMGDKAKGAVPALAQAVAEGDVEGRLGALYALQRISVDHAKAAVPHITSVLEHPEVRLRRLAAETLGKMGAAALSAIPALRRALGDDDAFVRVNASDAILSILAPPRKL